jgi:hypothetical protein
VSDDGEYAADFTVLAERREGDHRIVEDLKLVSVGPVLYPLHPSWAILDVAEVEDGAAP